MVRSQDSEILTISLLAAAGGVGVETIRFYQRKGLLDTPTRCHGVRRYGAEHLRRLRFIRHVQTAGFSLNEIKKLLALSPSDDCKCALDLAKGRIELLDAKIAELQAARDALQRMMRECNPEASKPCPMLTALDPAQRAIEAG